MSKIAKLISANVSYPAERKADIPHFNYADVTERTIKVENYIKYDIGVKLGAQVYLNEYEEFKNAIPGAIYAVRRSVIEEIFGEFRPLINEISIEAYNRDCDKIQKLVGSLYSQMFLEGLDE